MSDKTHAPVEVTTKYVTTVDELADAWAFVMGRVDRVGPNPRIVISPIRVASVADVMDGFTAPRQFEITVEGMTEENPDD